MIEKYTAIAAIIFLAGLIHTWIIILVNTGTLLKRVREIKDSHPAYRLKWYRRPILLLLIYLLLAATVFFSGTFEFPLLPD